MLALLLHDADALDPGRDRPSSEPLYDDFDMDQDRDRDRVTVGLGIQAVSNLF